MTRDEVLAMKPGSKLDLLVCEKVMKWITPWEPFFPSTDIAAAWEVVGKLQNDYVLDFKLERKYCVAAMKFVAVFEDLDGKKMGRTWMDSPRSHMQSRPSGGDGWG